MFRHTRATTVVSQPPMFIDVVGVSPADPQPSLLERIVGLGGGAQHPIGHRPEMPAVLLELGEQLLVVVHHRILARHTHAHRADTVNLPDVTGQPDPRG